MIGCDNNLQADTQLMQIAEWGANATIPERRSTYLNGAAAWYQVTGTVINQIKKPESNIDRIQGAQYGWPGGSAVYT